MSEISIAEWRAEEEVGEGRECAWGCGGGTRIGLETRT